MAASAGTMLKTAAAMVLVLASFSRSVNAFTKQTSFCKGWRFNVDVDNLPPWNVIPEICKDFVAKYMNSKQYFVDSLIVAENAINYARSLNVGEDGKDAWIFDVDETSLSNLPFYESHQQFGRAEAFNEDEFNEWVNQEAAPALTATLKLYNELKELGIKPIFLTGRDEPQRNSTVVNLLKVGYSGWVDLILRQKADAGATALAYKSTRRNDLEEQGYRIVGNIGDQWSDLNGYSMGGRLFKLPNPMYYIA